MTTHKEGRLASWEMKMDEGDDQGPVQLCHSRFPRALVLLYIGSIPKHTLRAGIIHRMMSLFYVGTSCLIFGTI